MAMVLVTGANRGIGLATSVALARAGHEVIATVRRPEQAADLKVTIESEQLPITIMAMDVDSDASVRDTIGRVIDERGPLDALVNNAGIERHGSVEELPLSEFRAVMETNYFGVIRCIQAALPSMRERGQGCVVNVTSVSGRLASPPLAPYTASKHALEALSEVLAQEVKAFGIRVAIVEPGIIDTAMANDITEAGSSVYPHARRMAALFTASLRTPSGPEVVAKTICEIVGGNSWQLRYPVGPDAAPFIAWRQAMSDEEWVNRSAVDDEAWYDAIERDFGLDARPEGTG
jgi:NAD(P)-dependent dehydrogenase (short-subunit alcohol dehydrogenase family)